MPVAAQPQPGIIYSCVAGGRTYSGDMPPPECANSDMRELNRDGSLRRLVPRPLTVEEQRARAIEAKKKLEEEDKLMDQRRRDRSLLEAYANEQEIEAARKKSLEGAEQSVKRSRSAPRAWRRTASGSRMRRSSTRSAPCPIA